MPEESGMDQDGLNNADKPVKTNSGGSPIEQPAVTQKENLPKPHFKFVLGHHGTKGDAEFAIKTIEDCDFIAFENIGGNPEERQETQAFWQYLADMPKDSPEAMELLQPWKEAAEKEAMEAKEFLYYEYSYNLALGLVGSGKKIILIDMPETDPNYQLIEKAKAAETEYFDSLRHRSDIRTLLHKARDYVDIWAEMITGREALIVNQLKELSTSLDEKQDIKIGVIEGMGHTYPSQQMHREDYSTQRVFQEESYALKGIGQRLYSWHEDAMRRRRFFPENELSDNFLKRVVARDLSSLQADSETELRRLDLTLEKMPEEEVDTMLSGLLRNQSDETKAEKGQEQLPKPHFKFILGPHATKEDAERNLRAAEDCDVIAKETVGGNIEDRENVLSIWQAIADEPKDSPRAIKLLDFYKKSMDKGIKGAEYTYFLLKGLNGTGKTIIFIDMNAEDPNYHLIEEFQNTWKAYEDGLNERQDLPTILSKLRTYTDLVADATRTREEIIIEQLKIIGKYYEDKDNSSIAVMEGGIHTQPSHQMHREGFSSSRKFIRDEIFGEKGIGQRMYDWGYQAVRQKLFFPDKPLTDNLLKRVVLEDLYESGDKSPEEIKSFGKALEKMPEEEVDAALARLVSLESPQVQPLQEKNDGKIGRAKKFLQSRREQRPPKK